MEVGLAIALIAGLVALAAIAGFVVAASQQRDEGSPGTMTLLVVPGPGVAVRDTRRLIAWLRAEASISPLAAGILVNRANALDLQMTGGANGTGHERRQPGATLMIRLWGNDDCGWRFQPEIREAHMTGATMTIAGAERALSRCAIAVISVPGKTKARNKSGGAVEWEPRAILAGWVDAVIAPDAPVREWRRIANVETDRRANLSGTAAYLSAWLEMRQALADGEQAAPAQDKHLASIHQRMEAAIARLENNWPSATAAQAYLNLAAIERARMSPRRRYLALLNTRDMLVKADQLFDDALIEGESVDEEVRAASHTMLARVESEIAVIEHPANVHRSDKPASNGRDGEPKLRHAGLVRGAGGEVRLDDRATQDQPPLVVLTGRHG